MLLSDRTLALHEVSLGSILSTWKPANKTKKKINNLVTVFNYL